MSNNAQVDADYVIAARRSQRRLARFVLTVFAVVAGWIASSHTIALAAESAGPFRRVYVPADRPSAWPVDGDRYLPIEKNELNRLLSLRQHTKDSRSRVESIRVDLRYATGGRLTGSGELQLVAEQNEPVFIPWPSSTAAVMTPRWLPPIDKPALLGAWPANAAEVEKNPADSKLAAAHRYEYGLAATESGRLAFDFDVWPEAETFPHHYRIALPQAARRQATLTLPLDVEPTVKSGLIERIAASADSEPTDKQWRIRLQGDRDLELTLRSSNTASTSHPTSVYYSLQSKVRLIDGGAECETRIQAHAEATLPTQLRLEIPATAAITEVQVDGEPTTWRIDSTDGTSSIAAVDLANRQAAEEASIVVRYWSSFASADAWSYEPLRLCDGVFEEGSVRVDTRGTLQIVDIPELRDAVFARQTQQSESAEPSVESGAFVLQFLRGDPKIVFRLAPRTDRRELRVTQRSELNDTEVRSQIELDFADARTTSATPLTLKLNNDWLLESVDSPTPGMIEDWRLESGEGTTQQLRIQLAPNRTDSRSNETEFSDSVVERTILFACRRSTPRRQLLSLDTLAPLKTANDAFISNKLVLTAASTYSLRLSSRLHGQGFPLSRAQRSNQVDASVVGDQQITFDLLAEASADEEDTTLVSLLPAERQYAADVQIDVLVNQNASRYEAEVAFDGLGEQMVAIPIFFDRDLPASAKWFDPSTDASLDARRMPRGFTRATASVAGETWLVRPATVQGIARIAVEFALPADREQLIPLAVAPDAVTHSGAVILHGFGVTRRSITSPGFTALPTTESATLRYSYDPRSLLDFRQLTRLSVGPAVRAASQSGFSNRPLRLVGLNSVWKGSGKTIHAARYEYEAGLDELRFTLPSDVELLSVTDAQTHQFTAKQLAQAKADPISGVRVKQYSVDLSDAVIDTAPARTEVDAADEWLADASKSPPQWRPFTVSYRCQAKSAQESIVAPLLPQSAAQAGLWQWQLVMPDRWKVADRSLTPQNWQARIFGSFAQGPDARPFNPLRRDDWGQLLRRLSMPAATADEILQHFTGTHDQDASLATPDKPAGWRKYDAWGGATSPSPVRLYDSLVWQACTAAILLLVMMLAVWRLAPHANVHLAVTAAAVITALLAPEPIAAVASTVVMGLLLSYPCSWLLRRWQTQPSSASITATKSVSRTATQQMAPLSLALFLAVGINGGQAVADDQADANNLPVV
ncbi:MAG: hypothetical protein AAGF31_07220, partial [Planctomycetota bacterium]